ncbi:hypothetical protein CP532_0208 [Ophiocordyceps camponoti-leonardi (nom. inval.)]|nr:hypothetical protein CP532_0208 [Ophiocordyceps camponoti-leonardi (nom. inval.)]
MTAETHVLKALEIDGFDAIPRLLDEFWVNGPNGSHPCSITEPAFCSLRGCSLDHLFPLDVARALAYELALAVAHMHTRGYAHGDLYLQNMLIRAWSTFNKLSIQQLYERVSEPIIYPVERTDGKPLPPGIPRNVIVLRLLGGKPSYKFILSDARILLNDFREAFIPANQLRLGAKCYTLPLFGTFNGCPDSIVYQVIDTLGPLPDKWWEKWEKRTKFFKDDGTPKAGRRPLSNLNQRFEESVQRYRRKLRMGEYSTEETAAILDLIGRMLKLKPEERISIDEVLRSEWIMNWARPDYYRSLGARLET